MAAASARKAVAGWRRWWRRLSASGGSGSVGGGGSRASEGQGNSVRNSIERKVLFRLFEFQKKDDDEDEEGRPRRVQAAALRVPQPPAQPQGKQRLKRRLQQQRNAARPKDEFRSAKIDDPQKWRSRAPPRQRVAASVPRRSGRASTRKTSPRQCTKRPTPLSLMRTGGARHV